MKNTNKTVALFGETQPELMAGIGLVAKKNGVQVEAFGQIPAIAGEDRVQIKLVLETRSLIAARLGLGKPNKDNAHLIDAEVERMKDAGKKMMAVEAARLFADPNWTFSGMGVNQAKSGKQRAMLALETRLPAKSFEVTPEQLVKALSKLSEDEQVALMEKAEAAKKGLEPVEA